MKSNKTWVIALQHLRTTALTKAFAVTTILGPFLILAISILPGLLANDPFTYDDDTRVAIVRPDDESLFRNIENALEEGGGRIILEPVSGEDEGRKLLDEDQVTALVALSEDLETIRYFSKSDTAYHIQQAVRGAVNSIAYQRKLEKYNIEPRVAEDLNSNPEFRFIRVGAAGDEDQGDEGFENTIFVVVTLTMLLYMTILFYGQVIARSVVLEKTSKTIDLMMSSVSSGQLMMGKILGIGTAGVIQYGIWIGALLLFSSVSRELWDIGLPASLQPGNLLMLMVFFVLGFLLYAAFYSAIGAASKDEQQVGQLGMPLILFLIVPMMMIAPITISPGSSMAVGLSLFPLTSPLVMVMRSVAASVPPFQVVLSAGILIASIFAVGYIAARIFRTGILMTGKKVRLSEVLRWIRE